MQNVSDIEPEIKFFFYFDEASTEDLKSDYKSFGLCSYVASSCEFQIYSLVNRRDGLLLLLLI